MSEESLVDSFLQRLLAGAPAHVLDAEAYGNGHATVALADAREIFATIALGAQLAVPAPDLRARLADALQSRPHRTQKTALLVMDMQVDHLTPGGKLEVPRARNVVPALVQRIANARKENTPIIYLCDRHDTNDPELEDWGAHNVIGSMGANVWPELAPSANDKVVYHRTYSGFFDTELESTLRALDVNRLVLCGCLTEVHLYLTAGDALMRGFEVEVPADSQAGHSETSEHVALTMLRALVPTRSLSK